MVREGIGRIALVVAILTMWAPHASAAEPPPATGEMKRFKPAEPRQPAPGIEFTDAAERPLTLESFRGKVVLLNFWATWCAPCVKEMPALARLQEKLGGDDFQVLALSQDRGGLAVVRRFYESQGGLERLTVYLDKSGRSARTFTLRGLPTTILIDREGREVGRLEGAAEWDSDDAVALMRHVIGKGGSERAALLDQRVGTGLSPR